MIRIKRVLLTMNVQFHWKCTVFGFFRSLMFHFKHQHVYEWKSKQSSGVWPAFWPNCGWAFAMLQNVVHSNKWQILWCWHLKNVRHGDSAGMKCDETRIARGATASHQSRRYNIFICWMRDILYQTNNESKNCKWNFHVVLFAYQMYNTNDLEKKLLRLLDENKYQ